MYLFNSNILLFIIINPNSATTSIPWITQPYSCLQQNAICVNNFISVIKVFTNIPSAEFCSRICQNTPSCQYFNFFPSSANPLLSQQCHLLDSCHTRRVTKAGPDGKVHPGPVGPVLGSKKDCSGSSAACLLPHPGGGEWFWFDKNNSRDSRDVTTVSDGTKVLYFCGDKPLETAQCEAGLIIPKEKVFKCPCKAMEESDGVECDIDEDDPGDGEVEGGTKCSKKCGDKVVEVSYCDLGGWTVDLSDVDCYTSLENDDDGDTWFWVIITVLSVITLVTGVLYLVIMRRVWRG